MKIAMALLCALGLCLGTASGGTKITGRLERALLAAGPGDQLAVWVFFTDKGGNVPGKLSAAACALTERALRRRAKVLPADRLVDETDLPLREAYINEIAPRVERIRQRSKWLNGVSVDATAEQIRLLEAYPFVRELELVLRYKRAAGSPGEKPVPAAHPLGKSIGSTGLNFGPSLPQVSLENIPAVHATGNSAQGILIGVFDNGVRLLNHEAFDSLRSRIIAQHDFVDHKGSVAPRDTNPGFGSHGVSTLSVLAGYKPGQIIGPAFGASFILARTENDSSETPIEEDNWAAAIEWAESLGVEVTSTSLGYLGFDNGYPSLTWADMDGKTAVITRAAVMAARKGVIVVNSAGNDGAPYTGSPNTLNAPADADSILTAGAVTTLGVRAGFSSCGPTADGRIKPDVMAVGEDVYAASGEDDAATGYEYSGGTSFSCPLTAGTAALVLKAHPDWTAMQIVAAIKSTARKAPSQASRPDNFYGWGIVDAAAAIGLNDTSTPPPEQAPQGFALLQNYPNPFNPGTTIRFFLPQQSFVTLKVFDLLGREVKTLVEGGFPASPTSPYFASWDGTDAEGAKAASGVYFCRMEARSLSGASAVQVRKMMLVR